MSKVEGGWLFEGIGGRSHGLCRYDLANPLKAALKVTKENYILISI